jgi:hypothetical protein
MNKERGRSTTLSHLQAKCGTWWQPICFHHERHACQQQKKTWKKWWLTYFSNLKECYKLSSLLSVGDLMGFFSSFFFIPFTWWFSSWSVNFPTKLIRIDFLVWNDNVFFSFQHFILLGGKFYHMVTLFFKRRKKKHEKMKKLRLLDLYWKNNVFIFFFKIWFKLSKI